MCAYDGFCAWLWWFSVILLALLNKNIYIKANYTVEKLKNANDESLKRRTLELYLEGLGFRSIGRLLYVYTPVSTYFYKDNNEITLTIWKLKKIEKWHEIF